LCAERLGFRHLDTGAMYRAVTMKILGAKGSRDQGIRGANEGRSQKAEVRRQKCGRPGTKGPRDQGIEWTDKALARLLRSTRVSVTWDRGGMRTFLDGKDVSEDIRAPEVSGFVSEVSAISAVRKKMVAEQRRVAEGQAVVCEGRDIGSVVFPDADLKIFIECDAAERARRRQLELAGQGVKTGRKTVLANLMKRDRIDSGREVSPLRRMPDAILIDTTFLTVEEQVSMVCDLARRRCTQLKMQNAKCKMQNGGREGEEKAEAKRQKPRAKSQKPEAKSGGSERRKADSGQR
jgi:CMP/dCMP kinase